MNGMYAFCIWDKKKNRLFCARDRLGIKPFFYTMREGVFYCASEIKGLLRAGIEANANNEIIFDYLAYGAYEHSEDTFFAGIRQLPPGHTLVVEPGRFEMRKYWDIDPASESLQDVRDFSLPDFRKSVDRFTQLLLESITLRLRSDVPIAVHVSGGLDSTLMMAALNRINGGPGLLKAFSYYYDEKKYDEKPYVSQASRKVGWSPHFCPLRSSEVPSFFEEAMWFQEQPFPGILTLAKHSLIKKSHAFGTKVVLEGQGGDEIGAGYQYNFGAFILDALKAGAATLAQKELRGFARQHGMNADEASEAFLNSMASCFGLGRSADGTPFVKNECLAGDFLHHCSHELQFPAPFRSHLLNMQYRDIRYTKLPRILRSCDRASMAYGRELRVPFLDYRLVEFSFALPGNHKVKDGVQRYFEREALKGFLDSRLAGLPKRAVVDPQREWLKGPLAEWVRGILTSRTFRERGIFDQKKVVEEYERYTAARSNPNSFHLWQWISLELWFRTFIDGGGAVKKDTVVRDEGKVPA